MGPKVASVGTQTGHQQQWVCVCAIWSWGRVAEFPWETGEGHFGLSTVTRIIIINAKLAYLQLFWDTQICLF